MRLIGRNSHRRHIPVCLALLMAGLLLVQCCAFSAAAAGAGVIRVHYEDAEMPLAGVKFSIYHIAERVSEYVYAPTVDFAGYPVENAEEMNGEELRLLTESLVNHVLKKALKPVAVSTTNASGDAAFSGLDDGLYLITGSPYSDGMMSWFCEPALVSLPDGFGSRDYTIEPKTEIRFEGSIDLVVRKIWKNDDDHKETRASGIDVQLYCNGNLYDTVTLDASNSWRHTWTELDALAEWHVTEVTKVDGYKTEVTRNEYEFIITNTYEEEGPPPDDELPRTGLLWWPVPVLLIAGIALFTAGLIRRRNGENA